MKKIPISPVDILVDGKTMPCLWNEEIKECRKCGQDIGWAQTAGGKYILFDLPVDVDGIADAHWDTCPEASGFRHAHDDWDEE